MHEHVSISLGQGTQAFEAVQDVMLSRSSPANSFASSARQAAESRRCSARWPATSADARRAARQSTAHRCGAASGSRHGLSASHVVSVETRARQRRFRTEDARLQQKPSDAAWLMRFSDLVGPGRFRRSLSKAAFGRHAAARRDRARTGQPAAPSTDGRALQRARRADAHA